MKKVDLHIHSYYSDGTYSVNEILNKAKENGVGVLSIADHNVIEAYKNLENQNDLLIIPGVEIDSHAYGLNFHILGYQCDFSNQEFTTFVKNINEMLEKFDEELLWKCQKDHSCITKQDYMNYRYDPTLGGWKSLNYLIEKGICGNLKDYFNLYAKYEHSNHNVNYPSVLEVVKQIHQANGYAVIAHPGKVIQYSTYEEFESILRKCVVENQLDGIECFYPTHSKEITEICLRVCKDYELMITCGSDCHGSFQKTRIGELNITLHDLNISKLIEKESD